MTHCNSFMLLAPNAICFVEVLVLHIKKIIQSIYMSWKTWRHRYLHFLFQIFQSSKSKLPRSVRSIQSYMASSFVNSSFSSLSPILINHNVAKFPHDHFSFSYTCSFVKWEVFWPNINFMLRARCLWNWRHSS